MSMARAGGGTPSSLAPVRVHDGRPIVVGLLALAWASLTYRPVANDLADRGGRHEGILLGLLFWIAIGLLGGMRVARIHGTAC